MKNPKVNKIIIGADHLGKDLKDSIKEHINNQGYKIEDIGVSSNDLVDYPDIGSELAKRISNKDTTAFNIYEVLFINPIIYLL